MADALVARYMCAYSSMLGITQLQLADTHTHTWKRKAVVFTACSED